ncbi:AAA family ATPase [Methanothermobacter wolfeii]|uniref:AAA family ATPase n=1 Tax=Methanothermobacter wolfeii TaxID=145261 RepID=A0A9E7RTF7_METWO|nr:MULTISPECIES: AAA family ATPase [Methanothermobacter]MDI6702925.1 AAA family ATPase [Methanothermobacter wolfeii]MDI6841451.1 AAA family ATPase [Methanothermobacter wolfeii]NLM03372.1 AAA family ATPase [Methanothermobacter wolfeii]QHN05822.1 AAA family ATPase [Methanothermobacter sp. THM-1]UXH31975.1 AAA family ATPase [Methanothermobacter wolfeii]
MIIAVSGKGGTGKTMFSASLIRILASTGADVLAIDADPDSNLPEALGVSVDRTVGDVREQLKRDTAEGRIPPSANKWDMLDYRVMESIVETEDFDVLVMGRPEGSGCYCAVNTMLRKIIENIASNYDYIVIDTEAGLEHLSRRTTQNVDVMIVVTDPSKRGVLTARRILELSEQLEIRFREIFLVLNRVRDEDLERLKEGVEREGIEVIGVIPEDPLVSEYDMEGKPLYELPEDSASFRAIKKVAERILNL